MELVIKNGTVVTANDCYKADLGISNGKVAVIAAGLTEGDEVIDAAGCLVFPGFIDPHTHMELPFMGTVSSDDFFSGTRAAACGGVTTIIDYCIQAPGETFVAALSRWKEKAEGKAVIDYGFHIAVPMIGDDLLDQMPAAVEAGVTSFKCFLAYKGTPLHIDDATLYKIIEKAKGCGALPMVHAENGDIVDILSRQLVAEGKVQPKYHVLSRPHEAEAEAVGRAIALARLGGWSVYVVHVSSRLALAELREARDSGAAVYGETCPQYLFLAFEDYAESGFEGAKYICSPPIRERANQDHLWSGLRTGDLQAVASDHCAFNFAGQKEMGRDDFTRIPNGCPGIETMFPLLFSAGVGKGRISLNRFVELSSTASARLFGLWPQKGTVAVGSDADLVVYDPQKETTLRQKTLHSSVDYCLYEGWQITGYPVYTISRGEVLYRQGQVTPVARAGRGRYLKRRRWNGLEFPLKP